MFECTHVGIPCRLDNRTVCIQNALLACRLGGKTFPCHLQRKEWKEKGRLIKIQNSPLLRALKSPRNWWLTLRVCRERVERKLFRKARRALDLKVSKLITTLQFTATLASAARHPGNLQKCWLFKCIFFSSNCLIEPCLKH